MNSNIKIDILPNYFKNNNGTFNKEEAIKLSGKIAGVCYDKEGFNHLVNEPEQKTMRRVDMTLNNGHHSVYDHIQLSLNLQNVPKLLAMIINNEHQYTTSEKSARYTPVVRGDNSPITEKEEQLYNKWIEIFKVKIKAKYGNVYNDAKILKLAQKNARYLVTVFMPTQMIYTTSLRQINYIASWMDKYINDNLYRDKIHTTEDYELSDYMADFVNELERLNILEDGLMRNEKHRKLSLLGENLDSKKDYFDDVYCTNYESSLAYLAQAQRHRTLDYQMEFMDDYIPPILEDDKALVEEWLADMEQVKNVIPQGELVKINEMGKYEDFILKCKERLCSAAQLEIMEKTKEILERYKGFLKWSNHPLAKDIEKYTHGARCTFPDFECKEYCKFGEGKRLVRKI